ncbi:MAG: U32 family peptidase [Methanosarcinaceae archaeon]|nr:U32 family peptidase [Methanosarcinaceae archaeon]
MTIRKPELLAPAGDMDALVAAVENGADAVYLGIKGFSARAYADNFTLDEFRQALDHAHLRGVRVYVTLNTLIKDTEIETAVNLMQTLDELGTDAIIVQDIGLLSLAKRHVPLLPVHASTQMTIHNSEGVRFLREMGVKRVVLAREMTLEEIKRIRQDTDIEIETFIHGALCICYSGQCLMSSIIGARSGNRGYCAQPCRKGYGLMREGKELRTPGKFLLSPADLNTSLIIPELMEAGICSFKIEGRMKRPEYVAGVVRIYRRLLDRHMGDPAGYHVCEEEKLQLEQLFNRGFTTGYFKGDPGSALMSRERPYNRGIRTGKVRGYDKKLRQLSLELTGALKTGDGIGFEEEQGSGTTIQQMYRKGKLTKEAGREEIINISYNTPLKKGTPVYRTLDSSLMKELKRSFESPENPRKVPVTIKARAHAGERMEVTFLDEDNNRVSINSDYLVEPAIGKATTAKDMEKQLGKLGNTVLKAKEIEISMGNDIFIPIREMNHARNRAAEELEKMRVEKKRRPKHSAYVAPKEPFAPERKEKPLLAVSVTGMEALDNAISGGADLIYYDGPDCSRHEGADLIAAASHARQANVPVYLHTPIIVKDTEMPGIEKRMNSAMKAGFEGIIAANAGVFKKAIVLGIPAIADSHLNIFNSESAALLIKKGAISVVLSPEMNHEQVKGTGSIHDTEFIVHGRLHIMVSEHGLVRDLTGTEKIPDPITWTGSFELVDEKGFAFPAMTDCSGRTHIFNSKELCLLEDIPRLMESCVRAFRIDARMMEVSLIEKVTASYRKAIDSYPYGKSLQAGTMKCSDISKEYTRGHFHRGVL